MKELTFEQVAHLYLGIMVFGDHYEGSGKGYLTGITNGGSECEIQFFNEDGINVSEEPHYNDTKDVKPVLRNLSDMTLEEVRELFDIGIAPDFAKRIVTEISSSLDGLHSRIASMGDSDTYLLLLSKGFDLYNLIERGIAIDASTLS